MRASPRNSESKEASSVKVDRPPLRPDKILQLHGLLSRQDPDSLQGTKFDDDGVRIDDKSRRAASLNMDFYPSDSSQRKSRQVSVSPLLSDSSYKPYPFVGRATVKSSRTNFFGEVSSDEYESLFAAVKSPLREPHSSIKSKLCSQTPLFPGRPAFVSSQIKPNNLSVAHPSQSSGLNSARSLSTNTTSTSSSANNATKLTASQTRSSSSDQCRAKNASTPSTSKTSFRTTLPDQSSSTKNCASVKPAELKTSKTILTSTVPTNTIPGLRTSNVPTGTIAGLRTINVPPKSTNATATKHDSSSNQALGKAPALPGGVGPATCEAFEVFASVAMLIMEGRVPGGDRGSVN